jgi:hypothetical protein
VRGGRHEEVTRAAVTVLMPVFNNLVLFDQHKEKNTLDTIVPDLAESWDIEAGLAKSGILRTPPDFCASAKWPPSQSASAVAAAAAILRERLITAPPGRQLDLIFCSRGRFPANIGGASSDLRNAKSPWASAIRVLLVGAVHGRQGRARNLWREDRDCGVTAGRQCTSIADMARFTAPVPSLG